MRPIEHKIADSVSRAYASPLISRRAILQQAGCGLGAIALAAMLAEESTGATASAVQQEPLAPRVPHLTPRAKSVIHLHMVGAPSQLDLFDYKPVLQKHNGELVPQQYIEGERFAFLRGHPTLMGTPFQFHRHGEIGHEFSEIIPHLASVADDLTVVKSVHTELFNHGPAQLFFHTGFGRFGRPSMGSWITYGLGTENANLPAYVVMITGDIAGAGNALWGSGFLPSVYQGTEFRSEGDPVLFLSNPAGVDQLDRRRMIDVLAQLNTQQFAAAHDAEIETRIAQYEMAFRMQASVPELMDLRSEPAHILKLYGAEPGKKSFANNCLLARRLVERGVRFVQLFDEGWDHHGGIKDNLPKKCQQVDQATAALIFDLKQRGLLDETLVLWNGEFGRTPMLQDRGANPGRDHHKDAFTVLMAGGGTKPGIVGATDEIGYRIAEEPIHVNDLHATLLHLLGLDHTRLTHKFQGRDFRLTDVAGHVVEKILG